MRNSNFLLGILGWLPKKYWNTFSLILAYGSIPYIRRPIKFKFKSFQLIEIDLLKIDHDTLQEFLLFCYPANEIADPQKEIELDRQYWPNARTFIVIRRCDKKIVGCIQVIKRTDAVPLPAEHAQTATGVFLEKDIRAVFPSGDVTEIYRCRKNIGGERADEQPVLLMLFKAVVACIWEMSVPYSLISYDPSVKELYNLYTRKLAFRDVHANLTFGTSLKPWSLLTKNWIENDNTFASLGITQFLWISWCRKNLWKKKL